MRYHPAMTDFDLHNRLHDRRPSTECGIAPLVIAGILAGAAALTGAGTAVAANAGTGNRARIKELAAAQGAQRLTTGNQMLLTEAERAGQRAGDQAALDAANMAAAQGATSGRDMQVLADARQRAAKQQADAASAAFAQLYQGEGQELEDRKAIRRDRTMEVGNFFAKGLSDVAGAVGGFAGASGIGKTAEADYGDDEDGANTKTLRELKRTSPETYAQIIAMMYPEGAPDA